MLGHKHRHKYPSPNPNPNPNRTQVAADDEEWEQWEAPSLQGRPRGGEDSSCTPLTLTLTLSPNETPARCYV